MFSPNVAFELEYAYRNADADLKDMGTSGTLTSNAFMANAIYSFPGHRDERRLPALCRGGPRRRRREVRPGRPVVVRRPTTTSPTR